MNSLTSGWASKGPFTLHWDLWCWGVGFSVAFSPVELYVALGPLTLHIT